MGTKENPGPSDCYAKAMPDEPVFVLLARDPQAPGLVRAWADERESIGEDPEKVAEARAVADDMEAYNSFGEAHVTVVEEDDGNARPIDVVVRSRIIFAERTPSEIAGDAVAGIIPLAEVSEVREEVRHLVRDAINRERDVRDAAIKGLRADLGSARMALEAVTDELGDLSAEAEAERRRANAIVRAAEAEKARRADLIERARKVVRLIRGYVASPRAGEVSIPIPIKILEELVEMDGGAS